MFYRSESCFGSKMATSQLCPTLLQSQVCILSPNDCNNVSFICVVLLSQPHYKLWIYSFTTYKIKSTFKNTDVIRYPKVKNITITDLKNIALKRKSNFPCTFTPLKGSMLSSLKTWASHLDYILIPLPELSLNLNPRMVSIPRDLEWTGLWISRIPSTSFSLGSGEIFLSATSPGEDGGALDETNQTGRDPTVMSPGEGKVNEKYRIPVLPVQGSDPSETIKIGNFTYACLTKSCDILFFFL